MINIRQLARLLWVVGMAALLVAVLQFLAVISIPGGPLPPLVLAGGTFLAGFLLDRTKP